MTGTLKVTFKELASISSKSIDFPKYTTQIINLANQNAQGTRPKIVGQLSDLIQCCPHKSYSEWKNWYLGHNPRAIDDAAERILEMVENLKEAIGKVDAQMVRAWVEDLVLVKTFIGLRFQEAILKIIASRQRKRWRLATPEEESKGIDGFIGNMPVSIKPLTYKAKKALTEKIQAKIVYYEKKKDGLLLDISEIS